MQERQPPSAEFSRAARDPWMWAAMFGALFLRILPTILWPTLECIRDECIYRVIAYRIIGGDGLTTAAKGWLPAPGYPYLLAWSKELTGSMQTLKGLQVFLAGCSLFFLYLIAHRVAGQKVARIAVFLFAIHPTLIFFTTTMWIETIYIFFLISAIWAVLWARDRPGFGSAALPGFLLGMAILFRGIATYLPPMYALAMMWPQEGATSGGELARSVRERWKHVLVMFLATILTVAPWSIYASPRQGGFLVSDATVGHVMWLGNNDYPPLTFDYGNGMLTEDLFEKYLRLGRRSCDRSDPPVITSRCNVEMALDWIAANPGEFLGRIPMRMAQLFNPNSFLTRHIRWGYWPGLPWWMKEGIAVYIVISSVAVQLFGTIAAWGRAKGPYGVMAVLTVAYTVFASMLMYGMTRFRLPLEPLWIVYLAWLLADPRGTWSALRASPARLAGAAICTVVLLPLMAWYLPTGFPMFW
jgi:hypothetical protein